MFSIWISRKSTLWRWSLPIWRTLFSLLSKEISKKWNVGPSSTIFGSNFEALEHDAGGICCSSRILLHSLLSLSETAGSSSDKLLLALYWTCSIGTRGRRISSCLIGTARGFKLGRLFLKIITSSAKWTLQTRFPSERCSILWSLPKALKSCLAGVNPCFLSEILRISYYKISVESASSTEFFLLGFPYEFEELIQQRVSNPLHCLETIFHSYFGL